MDQRGSYSLAEGNRTVPPGFARLENRSPTDDLDNGSSSSRSSASGTTTAYVENDYASVGQPPARASSTPATRARGAIMGSTLSCPESPGGLSLTDTDESSGSLEESLEGTEQITLKTSGAQLQPIHHPYPRRAFLDAFHSLNKETSNDRGSAKNQPRSRTPGFLGAASSSRNPPYHTRCRQHAPPPTPRGMSSSSIMQDIAKTIENFEEIRFNQKVSAINDKTTTRIREVWANDLYDAFAEIRSLRHDYNFVAMDTEFPGVYCKFPTNFNIPPNHYQYEEIRANVNSLKLIQLGLTLLDRNGNTPPGICTWQFNFKFSLMTDMYAMDSIKMLVKAGVQFQKHEIDGIDHDDFAYHFTTSGLVLENYDQIEFPWITFHCGYDFAYLTKILCGKEMPEHEAQYIKLVKTFFPKVYDIKYLMQNCQELHGGLQDVATYLGVTRHGIQHQAGSDSLLTGKIFFKINEVFFDGNMDFDKYNGCLYGFGTSYFEVDKQMEALERKATEKEAEKRAKLAEKLKEQAAITSVAVEIYAHQMRMASAAFVEQHGRSQGQPSQLAAQGGPYTLLSSQGYQLRLAPNYSDYHSPGIPDTGSNC